MIYLDRMHSTEMDSTKRIASIVQLMVEQQTLYRELTWKNYKIIANRSRLHDSGEPAKVPMFRDLSGEAIGSLKFGAALVNKEISDQPELQEKPVGGDTTRAQNSVPVRTVSHFLIEQVESLNTKAKRVETKGADDRGGCGENVKSLEVANKGDNSSKKLSYDSQYAKMKESAMQRAKEVREEEEERTRVQKARAMAKLEELNKQRTLSQRSKENKNVMPFITDQSKQQFYSSYAKGSFRNATTNGKLINGCDQWQRIYRAESSEAASSKQQQFHSSYAKGSFKNTTTNGKLINGFEQWQRIYRADSSEPTSSKCSREIDIDRNLPSFDARSSQMPSWRPVGGLPGRSRSVWIEKGSIETLGRTAPILQPRTKSLWTENP